MTLTTKAQTTYDVKDVTGDNWVARVDVNHDGLQDFIIYTNSLRSWASKPDIVPVAFLKVFVQQANGEFVDKSNSYITNNISPLMGVDLTLGNFNGDGSLDFALAGSGWDPYTDGKPSGTNAIDYGEPDLFFISKNNSTWNVTSTENITIWTHNLGVGDINLDGLDDVFSSSILSGFGKLSSDRSFLSMAKSGDQFLFDQTRLPSLLADGSPYFRDQMSTYLDVSGKKIYSSATFTGSVIFDANGDKAPDLAVFSLADTKNGFIYLNDGKGFFADKNPIELPAGSFGYGGRDKAWSTKGSIELEGEALDIEGDGDFDLVILSTNQNQRDGKFEFYNGSGIQVLKNDGHGTFSVSQDIIAIPTTASNFTFYSDIDVFDINYDGLPDLILTGAIYDKNYFNTEIYINHGGLFARATEEYLTDKVGQYFPFQQNGALHFLKYQTTPYAIDSRDGVSLSNLSLVNMQSTAMVGNTIAGYAGSEHLLGTHSGDKFLWSGGNDVYDGLSGVDTVAFSVERKDVQVIQRENYADLVLNSQSIASYSIERLKFTDINVALDIGPSQNAGSVYMLYKAAFNRAPDNSGMGYWLAQKDAGSNIVTNIAQGFVNSAEFTAKYGTNPSNASYVDKLYQNVLGREGEAGGVAYWNQQLDNGSVSKAAALAAFATLPEGASNVASLIANGIPYTEYVG